jgi:iron complex outermembrane receptor protein
VDHVRLGGRAIIVPAVRWSRLATDNRVAGEPSATESVVTPSLGLVVLPRKWLSLYTTWTRGFEPPTPGQYLENGRAVEPAEHSAFDGGLKADLLERRLSLTAAGFKIRRTNVPEADARGFYRQIGQGESHGLEVELVGRLTRWLGLRGGYAWTATEVTRDTSGFIGRELPNAPRHKAELWVCYRFPQGALRRLMIAGGAVHVSDRFTARDNAIVTPAYTRLDGAASYELADARLTLGVVAQNLTNRRYVTSGTGSVFIAGTSRRVAVHLTTTF